MRRIIVSIGLCGFMGLGCEPELQLTPFETVDAFAAPESAYFDASTQTWFVSNMAGAEPGDGYISRLSAAGDVVDERFIDGLNDPHGIRVHEGTLYVGDLNQLVVVDLTTPDLVTAISPPGAQYLNDTAVDPQTGDVYVSDTFGEAIYRFDGSTAELVLRSPALEAPNGLLFHEGTLLIASTGPDLDVTTFQTSAPGRVVRLDLATLELTPLTERLGSLDGIERFGEDLLVSDFAVGVYRVSPRGDGTLILTKEASGLGTTADIGFDARRRRLAVPDLLGTKVAFYEFDLVLSD